MTGSYLAVFRVVGYAIVGGFVGGLSGLVAKETFLSPGWDGGLDHLGNGLVALLIGVIGGALGAVVGVLLARRQANEKAWFPDVHPMLTLPVQGTVGAFLGSIISGGLWGGLIAGAVLLGIGLLAAQ